MVRLSGSDQVSRALALVQPVALLVVVGQRAVPQQGPEQSLADVRPQIEETLSLAAGQPQAGHFLELSDDAREECVARSLIATIRNRGRKEKFGHFVSFHDELPLGRAGAGPVQIE